MRIIYLGECDCKRLLKRPGGITDKSKHHRRSHIDDLSSRVVFDSVDNLKNRQETPSEKISSFIEVENPRYTSFTIWFRKDMVVLFNS